MKNRGPQNRDPEWFGPGRLPTLRQALFDLNWLLDRGYPAAASLNLVGNRFRLVERQRKMLSRVTLPAPASDHIRNKEVIFQDLPGRRPMGSW